jgi:sugar lactone lactonase YvrE
MPSQREISPDVELAFDAGNWLGESIVWSVEEQAFWWVNCEKPAELHRWSPGRGGYAVWPMPERIGGVVFKQGGGALVALAGGVYDFTPKIDTVDLKLRAPSPGPAHVKLHETGTDRQGRFWVGAYDHSFTQENRNPRGGSYFRLDGDRLNPVINGINVANGLAFSPDGRTLYAADSPSRIVRAYDLDPATGDVANPRDFINLEEGAGFLDGATVDAEGGYWLTMMSGNALRRYLPNGTLDLIVRLPFSNPTKLAFGGPGLDVLYITTTQMTAGPPLPGHELNGGVFACRVGFKGAPEVPFKG